MVISILTLFPEVFPKVLNSSIIGRAQQKGFIFLKYINIRDFATDKHRYVDDKPYGGGVGMIMRVDIVEKAIAAARTNALQSSHNIKRGEGEVFEKVILLDPKGKLFNQSIARRYSKLDHLILVCGHYEGIDERIKYFVDEKISIGKYILTGGEIPAMAIADAVIRLIPGVLRNSEATINESFSFPYSNTSCSNLEYPQYTRPKIYKRYKVPTILLTGNHQKIENWRKRGQLLK